LRTRKTLNELLAEHTGQTVKQIERDTERDHFMTAQEALAYGIVDQVKSHRGEIK
jgi:ATP-dependent Clp protease protease subunit